MANAIYPLYKQSLLDGDTGTDLNDGTVKVALCDTGTTSYASTHQYYSDVSTATIGTPQEITATTVTNGLFDGGNVTFSTVTGATAEALVIYIEGTAASTSRLVAYIDTNVTGLPVTPSGGDITVTWNGSGIFQL